MDRVTHLALCWRVERRDGVAIGLTDHDRDLELGGMVYRAAPGMTPSAIVRSEGLDPSTMDAKGALSSAAITVSRRRGRAMIRFRFSRERTVTQVSQ